MKIYKTKKGQPYIIDKKTGKARFVKRSSVTRRSASKIKIRGVRKMAKKRTVRRSKGFFGNLNRPLTGAAGVVLYESLVSPMIPLQGTAKDLLELVGGLYLSKRRGIVGATGQSLVVINSYQLIRGLVGNKLQGLVGTFTNGNNNVQEVY